ncbi:MAG: HAMP domain-containing histidine kinase [Actinobacteria bacterium]|nr:MAG: HAMP domain-containing histidine kinase [Actinomycetota bacterium]TML46809.1 MAG: HAMP domain-containing histidine kinase [Actinomycetota bacterium]
MLRELSLRSRLVLGVICLAALGLAVADIATYTSLRSFLINRTDTALDQDEHAFDQPGADLEGGPPNIFVQLRSVDGTRVLGTRPIQPFRGETAPSPPRLPAKISVSQTGGAGPDHARYFTVPTQSGDDRYRVRASIEPGASEMLVVATSLHDVQDTLDRLLLIELLVTGAVLIALAALGLWVVRLGLRPLREIEKTADAIAAGDLTRRVERAEERTEVGRLGLALNAMLSQIETAFRAQEASEQKMRRFVADASHELRTPLAAVRAYAELFTRGARQRPGDLDRAMSGISRESERMSTLVEDLLLLARLDEGRALRKEPVRLDLVVSEAVETAHAVDPKREIGLEAEDVVVLGDHDRLRQIVDNLLANVRAHTPADTAVRVLVGRQNGSAVIEVTDQGPGMSAEEIGRVFERFYRADLTRSRSSGGVGLGLSIVSAVAAAHGGTVEAHSVPGGGATFRILLPLEQRESQGIHSNVEDGSQSRLVSSDHPHANDRRSDEPARTSDRSP